MSHNSWTKLVLSVIANSWLIFQEEYLYFQHKYFSSLLYNSLSCTGTAEWEILSIGMSVYTDNEAV